MSADGVFNNPNELNGLTAYDQDGDKIGNVGHVYVDDRTSRPEWVTVKTGLFGMKESLVPLAGARRDGENLHVPYPKETVKDAPRLDADEHLDPSQEQQLYQHYGITGTGGGMGTRTGPGTSGGMGTSAGMGTGAAAGMGAATGKGSGASSGMTSGTGMPPDPATTPAGTPGMAGAGAGAGAGMRGTAARGSQEDASRHQSEELIRSEEQLHITTEEHEVGRARLRKIVVTENVTTSVPLSHEEVRVIHEPIAPGEPGGAGRSIIGEAQTEMTLHADQPVIRKETVAVERVRMETEKVTEETDVASEVRKEQIEYDPGRTDQDLGDKRGRPSH